MIGAIGRPPALDERSGRRSWRERAIPLGLAAAALGLAVGQRPGYASSDTKIDLHVDPAGFLADVASVWSSSGGLGQVQAGQYAGYLFPTAPFFALGHAAGLPAWLVHRLWIGALLALAAWGAVRLLDALLPGRRGPAQVIAGLFVLLNPYVLVFLNRTSVTLLAYAALPWLLLAVHRGVRSPRRWWWPAAFALALTATGGGINAAVTAWVLLGPLLLLAYEAAVGGVPWRDLRSFAWRTAATSVGASLWWIVPVAAHARFGLNFLPFTESSGAIWATTSLSESFRLMGYWISYLGVGYGERLVPYLGSSSQLLFQPLVVTATFAVPALALAGFAWTRRWRYGPFFLGLVLVGVLVMAAGFPEGAPLRRALTFTYNRVEAVQFLRTTYKAGPLAAFGLACLAGAAAAEAWRRLARRPTLRPLAAGAAALLLAVAAWPLVSGRAVDEQVAWKRIPGAWTAAADDLDRELPPSSRALVLPGQLFAFYRWGATVDPILPALSERPVAVNTIPPYSDLHAADLLATADSLVRQRRLLPGQLRPLLELMGVGAVVSGSDDDLERSGAMAPAAAAEVLERDGGLGRPERSYGRVTRFPPEQGDIGPSVPLPEVRRYEVPAGGGLVRVKPRRALAVVDGSAEGVAGLAALGWPLGSAALAYAGDRSAEELAAAAAEGAEFVITDSNRRRVVVSSRPRQNRGATLGAHDPIPENGAVLNPFAPRGVEGQTVATYEGARYLRAPLSPVFPQFPEHRPYAAFDDSLDTYWLADRNLDRPRSWVEVGFTRRRDVDHIDVLPARESTTDVTEVEVGGRRYRVRPGWNRLPLGLRGVDRLRVRVAAVRENPRRHTGAGGFAEIRVPRLRVRELLRPPRLVERALARTDLGRSRLTYLFARRSGDDPFRRGPGADPARGGGPKTRSVEAALIARPGDEEIGLNRVFEPPAPRAFSADGWVSVSPQAGDDQLDRLVGHRGAARFVSSGRFQGQPRYRASAAFDGAPARGWVGEVIPGRLPWLGWRTPGPATLERLRIEPLLAAPGTPGRSRPGAPTRVRVAWPGGQSPPLAVTREGHVRLPRPVSARAFRLEVLEARGPGGRTVELGPRPGRPPVAGAGPPVPPAVAIGELRAPHLPRVRAPLAGALRSGCGALRAVVGGQPLSLRVRATIPELEDGRPLRTESCGGPVRLPSSRQTLTTLPGSFRAELLRLRSEPSSAVPQAGGGRVVDAGRAGRGRYDGVRLALEGPSWLVLAESYNRGWRASCEGRPLGSPVVIDGFANGWPVDRGCRDVRFWFAANGAVRAALWLSGGFCVALLALLLVRRRPRAAARLGEVAAGPGPKPSEGPPRRWPARRALAAGAAAALVCGFLFAIRAGVVIGPLVALILWRGIGAPALIAGAAGLLGVVVPLLHLVNPVDDLGGFNSGYAEDQIAAHWVAVAAFVLLAAALWRTLAGAGRLSAATPPTSARGGGRGAGGRSRAQS